CRSRGSCTNTHWLSLPSLLPGGVVSQPLVPGSTRTVKQVCRKDTHEVIPLMPEPMVKQDGTEKNDCERNAAKRLIVKLRQDHPHLKLIVTEDSLSSNAPHIQVLHDHNPHYILAVKERDHPHLVDPDPAARQAA